MGLAMRQRALPLVFLTLAILAIGLVPSAYGAATCDHVAATNGNDAAAGSISAPYRTPARLIASLAPGQTGCLRQGSYTGAPNDAGSQDTWIQTPNVTLTSYPGERATLVGRLAIGRSGSGATVSNLNLDGRNNAHDASPFVGGDGAVLQGNDITNEHSSICVLIAGQGGVGRVADAQILENHIHDCGTVPSTNQDHGIYVSYADNTVIKGNWIYDNTDRGIQLYPDAQGTSVTNNVIDGNGEGIIFSGEGGHASSNTTVEHNVIANSRIRNNVESFYPAGTPAGTGNVVRDNCIFGVSASGLTASGIEPNAAGFTVLNNLLVAPSYVNRAGGDLTLTPGSTCAGIVDQNASAPSATIILQAISRTIGAGDSVKLHGSITGAATASSVVIMRKCKKSWCSFAKASVKGGSFKVRKRLSAAGAAKFRGVVPGLGQSGIVKVRVKA